MNWKCITLVASGAVVAAGCSKPSPEYKSAGIPSQPTPAWQAPIVATTPNRDALSYMARLSGKFVIADGCLSFVTGEKTQRPVFGERSPPVPGPDGVTWGRRKFEYGREYSMGGGQAPAGLEISEEARKNCSGEFVVIGHASPTMEEVLERDRRYKEEIRRRKQGKEH